MPKASIVIPCYNAERFLEQTLASARAQTVTDTEIICVDDGSTDGTLDLLERSAAQDARIRIIHQSNAGEGPSRDAGREAATGTWLYFLDADDTMAPTLLEEAIACGERLQADVVIFKTQELDDQTAEIRDFPWCFDVAWLGDVDLFDPHEHPERIFNSFQNWVHNKLFRGSFVKAHDLRFQHVRRSADLLFTCRALSEATRIALLDRSLHLYRVNNPSSALFTSDVGPLDFYEGFLALRDELERRGTWELYHDSFVNWAQEGVAMNLQRTRSLEDFRTIADTIREGGGSRLDLLGISREDAINPSRWDRCEQILTKSREEVLFYYFVLERGAVDDLRTECSRRWLRIQTLERDFTNVVNSTSFHIGRALTHLPRRVAERWGRRAQ